MKNKIHNAFESIEASAELKKSVIAHVNTVREQQNLRTASMVWKKVALTVCAVCMMLIGLGSYYTFYNMRKVVSYVSIDINPSIELSLNCYERVVSVAAYNKDGEILIERLDVDGIIYTDAIDIIIRSESMRPYLEENSTLTFTVAAENKNKETDLLEGIEKCSKNIQNQIETQSVNLDRISEAHECGMSFGKYSAYLELLEYDNTVKAEDCHDMTMDEIKYQIREHKNHHNSTAEMDSSNPEDISNNANHHVDVGNHGVNSESHGGKSENHETGSESHNGESGNHEGGSESHNDESGNHGGSESHNGESGNHGVNSENHNGKNHTSDSIEQNLSTEKNNSNKIENNFQHGKPNHGHKQHK